MGIKVSGIVSAFLIVSASACGWTMREPTDVINVSDELLAKDRSSFSGALANESFTLGSYKVADVDRKWNSTKSSSFFGFDSARTKGGYAYKLQSGETTLKGECATEDRSGGQKLGSGMEISKMVANLGCRCSDASGASTLTLTGTTAEQYEGELVGPEYNWKVSAITERSKGWASHDPLGYRIDGDGAPIGAVDLKRPGKVWISKAVSSREREELACVFAGLMLYLPPKDR